MSQFMRSLGLRVGIAGLAVGLLCSSTVAQPRSSDFFDGLRAYDARQIDDAIDLWTKAARSGDLRSQKQLGDLYRDGRRVPQNFATAYNWYALAATNPSKEPAGPPDRTSSGALLSSLEVVKSQAQSEAQKVRQYLTQADLMIAHTAIEDTFAQRGSAGLYDLGNLYNEGKVLPANKVEALRYYVLSSFQGSDDAVKARDAMTATLSAPQVASAQRAAAEWLKARGIRTSLPQPKPVAEIKPPGAPVTPAAPILSPSGPTPLPTRTDTPVPTETVQPLPTKDAQSPEQASLTPPAGAPNASFLTPRRTNLVSLNDARTDTKIVQQALKVLGFYKERINGDFGRQTARAISAFQRSIGSARTGQLSAGQLERLLQRAAQDRDSSITQYHYARMLLAGRYVDRDTDKAVKLFGRSADQGIAEAAFTLGVMYRDGVGVKRDVTMAATKFKLAGRLGHEKADEALKLLTAS